MKLRKLARGRDCQIRIPFVCNRNPETTVLAHYRLSGFAGTGQKPSDLLGAWACSACHDAVDGRARSDLPRDLVLLYHAEGVMRTLIALELEHVI